MFELLITDGESFCHEEKRDLRHEIDYPERNCLLYRLTNSDPAGRYRIVKHVLADPHRSVVLMRVRLEVADEALRGKLKLYALARTASPAGRRRQLGLGLRVRRAQALSRGARERAPLVWL